MANEVVNSRGTGISLKVGSGASTKIAGVTDFSGLGSGSAAVIDVTDLDSIAKEKMVGVMDEGQFKISYNVRKGDAGQAALDTARSTQALCELKVVTAAYTYTANCYVLSNETSGAVDQQVKGSANLELSGAVTKTATTA